MRRCDIPLLEDDPMLFEPPPEWLVPEVRRTLRERPADDDLGFRRLVEDPSARPRRPRPRKPWRLQK